MYERYSDDRHESLLEIGANSEQEFADPESIRKRLLAHDNISQVSGLKSRTAWRPESIQNGMEMRYFYE